MSEISLPPADPSTSISLEAWKRLLAKLDDATESICSPTGARTPQERAEGFRYLTRLLSAGLDMHLEHADSARPSFTRMLTPTRKFLGDNPDTHYDYVSLDGSRAYLLRGTRGSSVYLAFCTHNKKPDGSPSLGVNLSDSDMQFEDDGSFEIVLSAEKPDVAPNWIQLAPETSSMIIRHYYQDQYHEQPARYAIEVLPETPPLLPYTENELAERLDAVGKFVTETSSMAATISVLAALNTVSGDNTEEYAALKVVDGELEPGNTISAQELASSIDPEIISRHLPTPDIQYTGAWWRLREGEVLIVEGTPPPCRYWSVQILNRWMESPDYRHLQVSLNNHQVTLDPDGFFRIGVAAEDPGMPNWIHTAGHSEGQVAFRALMAEGPLEIKFRVAKISELHGSSITRTQRG